MDNGNHKKTQWRLDIGKQILSFAVGVIVASFVIGQARQKMHDMQVWKEQTAPRIERMDSKGTLSFELFEKNYEKTQARQEERIRILEQEMKVLQTSERVNHN
jgi:hypothetical protein